MRLSELCNEILVEIRVPGRIKNKSGANAWLEREEPVAAPPDASFKNIPYGQAHIYATFNNTIVSMTDQSGNVISLGERRHIGI